MEPIITKVDDTTVQISTPQPDKVVKISLGVLYRKQANAQALLDSITVQIKQAESLGVAKQVEAVAEPIINQSIILN